MTKLNGLGVPETVRSQYVRFDVMKNNYGPTGEVIHFLRRHDPDRQVSVLEPVTLKAETEDAGRHDKTEGSRRPQSM